MEYRTYDVVTDMQAISVRRFLLGRQIGGWQSAWQTIHFSLDRRMYFNLTMYFNLVLLVRKITAFVEQIHRLG